MKTSSMNTRYDLDCMLIHVPKAHNHYLPFGDFFNITYMPMGMPALAHEMRRRGQRIELLHLGVEWLADHDFDLLESLDGMRIRSFGLSLYWHYQSYDVIEVARALRAAHPEAYIFLGGVTASYFSHEIIKTYPFIDAVVRGHGEKSVPDLVHALMAGEPPESVPDVVSARRMEPSSKRNPITAGRSTIRLDDLVFADLSVMRHPEIYAQTFGFPLAYSRELTPEENRSMLSMGRPFFPLFTGRGCPYLCTFCGGNRDTLRGINGTSRPTWRSHESVLEDIRRAMDFGYRTMSLCFDPTPTRDAYYVELFDKIRRARLRCDLYFECWGLPTRRFIEAFRRAFPSDASYLALSPDAGNERVRSQNKQPDYSNQALFEALDLLKAFDILVDVFFTLALPGETLREAMDTAFLKREIATRYANTRRVMTWTVQLEPGSPQFERPESLGMVTDRHSFKDYHAAHGGDRADTYSSLGFKVLNYFGDERDEGGIHAFERHLQHLKCMEFCFLAKDPRRWNKPDAGRMHCLERRVMLAKRRGHAPPRLLIGPDVDYEEARREELRLRGRQARMHWVKPPSG